LAYTYSLAADGTKTTNQYDASGNLTSDAVVHTDGSSEAKLFAGGELTQDKQVHADGSKDVYTYDILNRTYTNEHDVYSTTGVLTETLRTHADNSLAYTFSLAADGTKTTDQYDASGNLTSDAVVHTDGSSETMLFVSGELTQDKQVHADGSRDVYDLNISGKSYVANHYAYGTNGKLAFTDLTNTDGSHTITANAAGVTLTSTTGVSDNLKGASAGADTFVFQPNFGNDTVSNYTPGHDIIAIDHTIFASASAVVAAATEVGNNAVIHVDANDSITLIGISVATLSQHQNDFHIV
jgi:YD repeat-containing protein